MSHLDYWNFCLKYSKNSPAHLSTQGLERSGQNPLIFQEMDDIILLSVSCAALPISPSFTALCWFTHIHPLDSNISKKLKDSLDKICHIRVFSWSHWHVLHWHVDVWIIFTLVGGKEGWALFSFETLGSSVHWATLFNSELQEINCNMSLVALTSVNYSSAEPTSGMVGEEK